MGLHDRVRLCVGAMLVAGGVVYALATPTLVGMGQSKGETVASVRDEAKTRFLLAGGCAVVGALCIGLAVSSPKRGPKNDAI